MFHLNVLNTFQKIHTFTYQKTLFHTHFCLFLKSSKASSVSLSSAYKTSIFLKSSICDYSDAFILVIGDITVTVDNNTDVAFKNYVTFSTCKAEIIDEFTDETNHIYIAMPMYNFTEHVIQTHQEVHDALKEMNF